MLSDVAVRVFIRAVRIKMRTKGMTAEEAINSYPKLSEAQKQQIRDGMEAGVA